MVRSIIPLLLLCMAFLERAVALHLCVDRLFNNTQGRHDDGLPHLNQAEEATYMDGPPATQARRQGRVRLAGALPEPHAWQQRPCSRGVPVPGIPARRPPRPRLHVLAGPADQPRVPAVPRHRSPDLELPAAGRPAHRRGTLRWLGGAGRTTPRPFRRALLAGLTHGNQTVNASEHSNDGLTPGMWEVDARNATSIADWIVPVPQSLNSYLVSLTQRSGEQTFVLSVSATEGTLAMDEMPVAGSDACVHATLFVNTFADTDFGTTGGVLSLQVPNVTIAPFDKPGMAITNALNLTLQPGPDAFFNPVPGLDGLPGTVSLELGTRPGCFVMAPGGGGAAGYSPGDKAQVGCQTSSDDDAAFRHAASFTQAAPLRVYHPLSFAARGTERNFLLEPLRSLQDEFYTVYFNLVTAAADDS